MQEKIITVSEFKITDITRRTKLLKRPAGNPARTGKNKRRYKDLITAFDIETTSIDEVRQSVMYIWQWCFFWDEENYYVVIGRTWSEFLTLCDKIAKALSDDVYIVVFVHNLSFEYQYLRGVYQFEPENVFAVDRRKILKCDMLMHFEFRCSYLHSNMSLDVFTTKFKAAHLKLSGDEFDYNKRRFWYTELSDREQQYCINDVIGLCEALNNEMTADGDNLYTLPLTSTGYVRRDAKRAMHEVNHMFVKQQLPDLEIYRLLSECFRGGNTHANRYYTNITIGEYETVKSADRSSSYPEVLVNHLYPISNFILQPGVMPFEKLMNYIDHNRAVICRVRMWNVRLRNPYWGAPYLSRHKCRNLKCGTNDIDNGRVLRAAYLETSFTDVDLRIFLDEYDADQIEVFDVATARYGKLPAKLLDVAREYYKRKTELKDVKGSEILYIKAKNKLNSIYGMMAQDPVKHSIKEIGGVPVDHVAMVDNIEYNYYRIADGYAKNMVGDLSGYAEVDEDDAEIIANHNRRAFLAFQWGVYCTAWARYELESGIKLAHAPGCAFVYADTDSVKYTGTIDWSKYNEQKKRLSRKNGAFADDPNGKRHYMGVYEYEGEYRQFRTLGAKKYAYVDDKDTLHITIAGVSKTKGAAELAEHGRAKLDELVKRGAIDLAGKDPVELANTLSIDMLKEGFIFDAAHGAAGVEATYNDHPAVTEYVTPDGISIPITSNIYMLTSTYVVGLSGDYARLLNGIQLFAVDD